MKKEPPTKPSSPLVALNIFLSVVLGLMAGVALAFFVEYLDVSIKTVDEVENISTCLCWRLFRNSHVR